jgi:antitoxin CcdA
MKSELTKKERERRWREENCDAMEAWNRYVEEHGLPLEEYRLF